MVALKKVVLLISSLLTITLTGCAGSIYEKNQLVKSEEGIRQIGEFPIYYKDMLDSHFKKDTRPLFTPTQYVTGDNLYGWVTCLKNENEYILLMLKGNSILSINSSIEHKSVEKTCNYYANNRTDSYQEFWREARKEVEKLKNDPSKDFLFGKKPDDAKQLIQDYMSGVLKDPDSAKYRNMEIRKDYIIINHKLTFGYVVSIEINGKNSYGAYTGFKSKFFKIKDNKIIEVIG